MIWRKKNHLIITFFPAGARKAKHSSSPLSTIVDRAPSTTLPNCKIVTNMINIADIADLMISTCCLPGWGGGLGGRRQGEEPTRDLSNASFPSRVSLRFQY